MTSGATAWLVDERWMKAYPLADKNTTIGRGANSTIILRDPAVSRHHAEVWRDGEAYTLRPQGSAGTKLNGMLVGTDCVLTEGDVIEIAFTSLRFTRSAPTGEMFIVRQDPAVSSDRWEVPTRATLHAMHPITLMSRSRRYWHWILLAVLIVGVVAICA